MYTTAHRLRSRASAAGESGGGESGGVVWFLQHSSCITRGLRTRDREVFAPSHVPVYGTTRGGLATYHGPGQLVVYPVVDFAALGLGLSDWARKLVLICEQVCKHWCPDAKADYDKMGVYTPIGKMASIGLRAVGSFSIHGISINVHLQPNGFQWIDPCGVAGGQVDELHRYAPGLRLADVAERWWYQGRRA